jgi:hypothetical protein
LLSIGKTWIVQEKVPAWFGTWWVHLIAIIITLLLMKRADYLTGSGVDSSKVKGVKSGS